MHVVVLRSMSLYVPIIVNDDSCGVHSRPYHSVVNDDSCGVHSRPYHSGCVIACVMQVREEHAMGHDPGVQTTETRLALKSSESLNRTELM